MKDGQKHGFGILTQGELQFIGNFYHNDKVGYFEINRLNQEPHILVQYKKDQLISCIYFVQHDEIEKIGNI